MNARSSVGRDVRGDDSRQREAVLRAHTEGDIARSEHDAIRSRDFEAEQHALGTLRRCSLKREADVRRDQRCNRNRVV